MTASAEEDREAFRRHVTKSREHVDNGDADAANAEVAQVEQLSARWDADGRLAELLEPLLADGEEPYVRFSAGSYLLYNGQSDIAVPALEQLKGERRGLASADAGLILGNWRASQSS